MKHMKRLFVLTLISIGLFLQLNAQDARKKVKISTKFGDIIIELYNETPQHRDNFIKLANEKFFDGLLFHRVINEFMIQGGDPESKGAAEGARLGNGGPGYQIPAEFVDGLFHKKGALAAARESDQVNPERKSSGSQFYIVQGKVFSLQVLKQMQLKFDQNQTVKLMNDYFQNPANAETLNKVKTLQQEEKFDEVNEVYREVQTIVTSTPDYKPFEFTPEQIEAYTTVGGTPHLDGAYTVFGQVIEGLKVIDAIAVQQTDKNNRPVEDIEMNIEVIE
jgi:cyclophilin family peptidyl-prolyl cis-trans isomerase